MEQELNEISHNLINSVLEGKIEEVQRLLDSFKHALCSAAVQNCDTQLTDLVSVNISGYLNTALYVAVSNDNVNLVEHLLKEGADVNAGGPHVSIQKLLVNPTPLHIAVKNGSRTLTRLILENSANVYVRGQNGTALHVAAYCGHLKIARDLLEFGADVNSLCPSSFYCSDYAPLHCAAVKNDTKMIRLLVSKGANRNANLQIEGTPLHVAIKFGSYEAAVALLKYKNVDLNTRCFRGSKLLSPWQIKEENRSVLFDSSKFFTGYTPLHSAAENGCKELIHLLVSKGANINASHHTGGSPLHRAIEYGNEDAVKALLSYDNINLNIAENNNNTGTPVFYAALFGREDFVRLILNKSRTTFSERNGYHVTFRIGYNEAIWYLLSFAAAVKHEFQARCPDSFHGTIQIWKEEAVAEINEESSLLFMRIPITSKAFFKDGTHVYKVVTPTREIAKHMAKVKSFGGHFEFIDEDPKVSSDFRKFIKEMEDMKSMKFFPSSRLSYFDIFRMSAHGILMHIEDEDVLQVKKSVDHHTLFPMCGGDINHQVLQAAERIELLKECDNFFSSIARALSLSRALPHLCINKICSYLRNENLKILKDYKKSFV